VFRRKHKNAIPRVCLPGHRSHFFSVLTPVADEYARTYSWFLQTKRAFLSQVAANQELEDSGLLVLLSSNVNVKNCNILSGSFDPGAGNS
jgi:hypothetical protein